MHGCRRQSKPGAVCKKTPPSASRFAPHKIIPGFGNRLDFHERFCLIRDQNILAGAAAFTSAALAKAVD
jgi:hypothetical protein